jgi:hypothetical protein
MVERDWRPRSKPPQSQPSGRRLHASNHNEGAVVQRRPSKRWRHDQLDTTLQAFFFSQTSNSMAASTRIVDAGACQGKNVVRIVSSAR